MSDIFSATITVTFPSSVSPENVTFPSSVSFTGIGTSTISGQDADNNAYTAVKNAMSNSPKMSYYSVKVFIQLSDKHNSNGVSSIITASGTATATCTDGDIFKMTQNAYNSANSAATDSLTTHAGLLGHADIHSQATMRPKE